MSLSRKSPGRPLGSGRSILSTHSNKKLQPSWQNGRQLPGGFDPPPCPEETMNAEEAVLLKLLAQGELAVFWKLWEAHQKHLYSICLRQMEGIQEEAEDALSRIMLKAWDKLPAYAAQIENLKAWLIRLACNLCIDMHRERRRARGLECLDEIILTERDPAAGRGTSPEEASIQREISLCLHQVVGNLPPRLREPFVLRFFHEASYPEIAECLALSPANVRKRIQQARVILRGQLHQHLAGASGQIPAQPATQRNCTKLCRSLNNSQTELWDRLYGEQV